MTIFDELAEHASLPIERARMLPLEAYRSTPVLERELEELFGRDWVCVGRSIDVPEVGDHLTVELASGRSIVVVRGDDGRLRALDNVCLHRGAPLTQGAGCAARFTCPYHAWVYRLDGSLIGAPYMPADFDPTEHRLGELALEEWEGFVFVNEEPDATPLTPRLAGLKDVVGRYGMEHYEPVRTETEIWETNWKLLAENFLDAYHVFHVHRASFGADGDSTDETEVFPGTDAWTHHRVAHLNGPDLAPPGSPLEGDWRRTIVLAGIFPGLVLQLQPDWMWSLRLTPLGSDRVRIESRIAVAPDADVSLDELFALIDQVNAEDRPVVEGIRQNLDRPQFERAPLSPLERNVYDFDRYVATRLTVASRVSGTATQRSPRGL